MILDCAVPEIVSENDCVLTFGELASLTVGQLELDTRKGKAAYVRLHAVDEKAGRGADIPLRADLAVAWLDGRLEAVRDAARAGDGPLPAKLSADAVLFDMPKGLLRIFNRDVAAAGIPKKDDRGRTICLHGLRHTFGTHLSKAGVPMRIA